MGQSQCVDTQPGSGNYGSVTASSWSGCGASQMKSNYDRIAVRCACDDNSRGGRAVIPDSIIFDAQDGEDDDALEVEVFEFQSVNWRAHEVIPPGWARSALPVPKCFFLGGGDACCIEQLNAKVKTRRILVALPGWAVDKASARWLSRTTMEMRNVCKLTRYVPEPEQEFAFLEFEYPAGETLETLLESKGRLSESGAKSVCRDLLSCAVVNCISTPLRFRGLLDASSVFTTTAGTLSSIVPLGGLLSYKGIKACVTRLVESGADALLPPELARAIQRGNRMGVLHPGNASASDTYSVMATVLASMTNTAKQRPAAVLSNEATTKAMSQFANDLLRKALYKDPGFRLNCNEALSHPWLQAER
ncbi:unnamed protein product [Polarella glacialis]|uniref:Protein kinase domain-containing protein n=2 Tax=Polarella glacialis TaxID=89957 RepID=A0A813KMI8_POLGL|nr:unnamed protein product [Polarella glacialis]